ncbi:hypothetical protein T265_00619 [Opisthorchis viverrini]|uniref:Uncharacterized protein n=1 Tax=Opisthorchis viverrini TaxID=6198 RepID=A0A075A195_OPIVI|nr:hypothetical protein T265_00619 [Opisthorchis viverrini]KER33503.1 hypothetical protein T265_00619 [Opisthorchis viverrini]
MPFTVTLPQTEYDTAILRIGEMRGWFPQNTGDERNHNCTKCEDGSLKTLKTNGIIIVTRLCREDDDEPKTDPFSQCSELRLAERTQSFLFTFRLVQLILDEARAMLVSKHQFLGMAMELTKMG